MAVLAGTLLVSGLAGGTRAAEPTSSPFSAEKVQALIGELRREYALPPTPWGGAVLPGSLEALQAVCEGAERAASQAAKEELIRIGKPALPQVIGALQTAQGREAQALAQVLSAVGGRETMYPLLRLADDPNQEWRARLAAAVAVARQGDQSQWPLLLAGLWLSGERRLLSDAIAGTSLVSNDLDRARLQWFRRRNNRTFEEVRNVVATLAPQTRAASVPADDIWGTIVAWDKWWTKARPFRTLTLLSDDPWRNRVWCERTLGTLSEYGPLVGEMRRLFIEERLKTASKKGEALSGVMADLASMTYGAEPFPTGTREAERFSLSGYVRTGSLISNYGYGRKTGTWVLIDKVLLGVDNR